jgi:hypothetical protein
VFGPQALANIAWSSSTIRVANASSPSLIIHSAMSRLSKFGAQALTNTTWGIVRSTCAGLLSLQVAPFACASKAICMSGRYVNMALHALAHPAADDMYSDTQRPG